MVVQILHTLLAFSALSNFILGVLVLTRRKSDLSVKLFSLTAFCASGWGIATLMLLTHPNFIFDQIATITGAFTIGFLGLYISSFSNLTKKERYLSWVYFFGFSLFFSLMTIRPGIFIMPTSEVINETIIVTADRGPLQGSFGLFGLFAFIIYLVLFIKAYRGAVGKKRTQIKYVFLACIISSVIALVTNLFLPTLGIPVYGGLGPICSLFFVAITANSIIKNEIFHIKIFLSEIIVFIF